MRLQRLARARRWRAVPQRLQQPVRAHRIGSLGREAREEQSLLRAGDGDRQEIVPQHGQLSENVEAHHSNLGALPRPWRYKRQANRRRDTVHCHRGAITARPAPYLPRTNQGALNTGQRWPPWSRSSPRLASPRPPRPTSPGTAWASTAATASSRPADPVSRRRRTRPSSRCRPRRRRRGSSRRGGRRPSVPAGVVTSTSQVAPFSPSFSTALAVPPPVSSRAAAVARSACGPVTVPSPSSPDAMAAVVPAAPAASRAAAPMTSFRFMT